MLLASHLEALRNAAITYLDECFSAIAEGQPVQSYADTPIGSYLPSRYEHYLRRSLRTRLGNHGAVIRWRLGQPGEFTPRRC